MDFTSLYSTKIQATYDDDQALILKTFLDKLKSKDGLKVTLTNYHKGLPLIYPATVVAVEKGNIDLDVNEAQAAAIDSDRYTLIRSKLFPDPIAAHVQYINVKKRAVSLNKFCFIEVLAEKRSAVRVNLDPPVRATVQCDGQKIVGKLLDISTQGVAVSFDDYVDMEPGAEMTVMFMLADPALSKHTMVKMPATLVVASSESSPYCYKLKIKPEKDQEQLISRYSFQRQVEIIRGLKESADL